MLALQCCNPELNLSLGKEYICINNERLMIGSQPIERKGRLGCYADESWVSSVLGVMQILIGGGSIFMHVTLVT